MGITEDTRMVALPKSRARITLLNFREKEPRIQFETNQKLKQQGRVKAPLIPADTFHNIFRKTREELLQHYSMSVETDP